MIAEAVERAHAYAEAGADGLFAPGLTNLTVIARLAEASPLRLNIMVVDSTPPLSALAENGVARVSHGPASLPAGNESVGRSDPRRERRILMRHMRDPLSLLIDRLDTPIGEILIVMDHDGNLRAVDWADHETRTNRLLRIHYGKLIAESGLIRRTRRTD